MGTTQNIRRFRVNPVEVAIFSIVTLIFLNSVYNLFYDRQGFRPTALAPMAANPISEGLNRTPAAATAPSFLNYTVKCDDASDESTTAAKVRLTGDFCGLPKGATGKALRKTEIENKANRYAATTFPDVSFGKFSTDYIPLNAGKNLISIKFTYEDGTTATKDVTIDKK